jgi:hypothetical protein
MNFCKKYMFITNIPFVLFKHLKDPNSLPANLWRRRKKVTPFSAGP